MGDLEMTPSFYQGKRSDLASKIGKDTLLAAYSKMQLIRQFELRAEASYLQGKIGGFFHSYIGQEAIQTAAFYALSEKNFWTTSYRCHALALLLGVTPDAVMAELFGRVTGNAKGRGGSMHLYSDRLLGGFGIVGGQIPVATGAGFSLKYKGIQDELSICFLGEGAVAQGAFHESLNLAALWNLPCLYVIENNKWGMGTAVHRALANKRIAEEHAKAYNISGYTFNGMDFLDCYAGFQSVKEEILKTKKPVLVEVVTERFKGHSISDPALYRTKESLKACMEKDPLLEMQKILLEAGFATELEMKTIEKECKEIVLKAIEFAEKSPWPDVSVLGEDVLAPDSKGVRCR